MGKIRISMAWNWYKATIREEKRLSDQKKKRKGCLTSYHKLVDSLVERITAQAFW